MSTSTLTNLHIYQIFGIKHQKTYFESLVHNQPCVMVFRILSNVVLIILNFLLNNVKKVS